MKMNQFLTCLAVFVVLCSILFLQSCKDVCSCKKVPCPGYSNANFDQWFPYDSAQQVVYADSTGAAADTALIHYASARQAYEASKGCYHSDAGCSSDKSIFSNIFNIRYYSNADWSGVIIDSIYNIDVYDFSVQAQKLDNNGLGLTSVPSAFYAAVTLNGKAYQNVQAIWRTDTVAIKRSIYKIYIQKSTGLLAYEYYPSKTIYLKK